MSLERYALLAIPKCPSCRYSVPLYHHVKTCHVELATRALALVPQMMSPRAIPKLKPIVERDHKPSFIYFNEPAPSGCNRDAHMEECRCPLILALEEATKMMMISIGMASIITQTAEEQGRPIEDVERLAVVQVRKIMW